MKDPITNEIKPIKRSLSEWRKFWEQREFVVKKQKEAVVNNAPEFIKKIFHTGPYFVMVIDYQTMSYDYANGIEKVLGYTNEEAYEGKYEFLARLVHPDDMEKLFGLSIYYHQFVDRCDISNKLNFKGSINFRIRKKDGEYIKVLEEVIGLKLDENGKITHALKYFTEISRISYSNEIILAILDDKEEGNQKFYTFDLEEKQVKGSAKTENYSLTKRELEILRLASSGATSKEIANKLQVSPHTINKHRENMMRKTGSRSINEVISFAYCNEYLK
jgi:DNA-binding CsgD family transcriptional regulator